MRAFCTTCDRSYGADEAAACRECHVSVCDLCVNRDGLCVECADTCGVCLANEPAEPDYDAPSFAERHEAAWADKRRLG